MKICVIHVTAESVSGPYTDLIVPNFEKAKSDGTTVVHKYVRRLRRATDTVFAYPTLLNKLDVIECAVDAEQEGCDGVMVACSGDTGVQDARTVVKIPVVGPMEAGLLLASSYGREIGIVTVEDPTWISYMKSSIYAIGLGERFTGLRPISIPSSIAFTSGFTTDIDKVGEEIHAKSRELVDAGAESIVIGSAGLSVMATHLGLSSVDNGRAPIFDCLTVGLKMAELRADLQKRIGVPPVSNAGWFEHFPAADRQRVDRLFGRHTGGGARDCDA